MDGSAREAFSGTSLTLRSPVGHASRVRSMKDWKMHARRYPQSDHSTDIAKVHEAVALGCVRGELCKPKFGHTCLRRVLCGLKNGASLRAATCGSDFAIAMCIGQAVLLYATMLFLSLQAHPPSLHAPSRFATPCLQHPGRSNMRLLAQLERSV